MYKISDKNLENYDIVKTVDAQDINVEFIELKHKITKASIILMNCSDKNRVFNIAFKTPVANNKGVPHILEHSVLCGSRKYNVKDPFVELAKSSMNTFLNAMTFPDKTCYPVASANLKDFHNLVDVYLDAVFYPNAIKDEKIFMQEGWHYEIKDKDSDFSVNGVVLNEMKGVYSSPDGVLQSATLKNHLKGTNYEFDYGGHPDEIINLSFEEFKDFHKMYYSPSNAIIYFYGDLDFNAEIENLNENYLKNFDYIDVKADFVSAKNITKDAELVSYYNSDDTNSKDKAYFSYNFSTVCNKECIDKIAMSVLDYVLFSSESAILRNKFLELGLGESVYAYNESELKDTFYSVVAQNIDESKKELFKQTLIESINDLINNGIPVNKLKAGINSIHFSLEEANFGRTPKGLIYSLYSLDTYLYDSNDLCSKLMYKKEFSILETIDLNDRNNIFYKVLKNVFIDGTHRTFNILLPKMGYLSAKEMELKNLLDERKKSLTSDSIIEFINKNNELKDYQSKKDSEEDLKCIPTLKKQDLVELDHYVDYEKSVWDDVDTIIVKDNDKDVVYSRLNFEITDLTDEELYLLSIISHVLTKTDLSNMTYDEFNDYVDINTGGLDLSFNFYSKKAVFTIKTKAIYDKIDYSFDIIKKVLLNSVFKDDRRIAILINEVKANSQVDILSSGHISAMNRAESSLTRTASIQDKLSTLGIAAYKFVNSFLDNYENNKELFNETLEILYKKLLSMKKSFCISANEKHIDAVKNSFKKFNADCNLNSLINLYTKDDKEKLSKNIDEIKKLIDFNSFEKKVKKEAIVTMGEVNYVAIAMSIDVKNIYGQLCFIRTLFGYEYLWTKIRVLGGAYGCMSTFKKSGVCLFSSYRDPNLMNTILTYNGIYDYLKNASFSKDFIEKIIIGSISIFDNPQSTEDTFVGSVAAFYNNFTDEDAKTERKNLINITNDEIKNIANSFSDISNSESCAIISEKAQTEAKENYDLVWKLI